MYNEQYPGNKSLKERFYDNILTKSFPEHFPHLFNEYMYQKDCSNDVIKSMFSFIKMVF